MHIKLLKLCKFEFSCLWYDSSMLQPLGYCGFWFRCLFVGMNLLKFCRIWCWCTFDVYDPTNIFDCFLNVIFQSFNPQGIVDSSGGVHLMCMNILKLCKHILWSSWCDPSMLQPLGYCGILMVVFICGHEPFELMLIIVQGT